MANAQRDCQHQTTHIRSSTNTDFRTERKPNKANAARREQFHCKTGISLVLRKKQMSSQFFYVTFASACGYEKQHIGLISEEV